MQTATAQPPAELLADLLDAHVRAHLAGVSDADVALLMEIGETIATFCDQMSEKFGQLTSGAIGTNVCNPEGPPKHAFEWDSREDFAAFLLQSLEHDGYGYSLDHADVIAAAVAWRLAPAAPALAQAA